MIPTEFEETFQKHRSQLHHIMDVDVDVKDDVQSQEERFINHIMESGREDMTQIEDDLHTRRKLKGKERVQKRIIMDDEDLSLSEETVELPPSPFKEEKERVKETHNIIKIPAVLYRKVLEQEAKELEYKAKEEEKKESEEITLLSTSPTKNMRHEQTQRSMERPAAGVSTPLQIRRSSRMRKPKQIWSDEMWEEEEKKKNLHRDAEQNETTTIRRSGRERKKPQRLAESDELSEKNDESEMISQSYTLIESPDELNINFQKTEDIEGQEEGREVVLKGIEEEVEKNSGRETDDEWAFEEEDEENNEEENENEEQPLRQTELVSSRAQAGARRRRRDNIDNDYEYDLSYEEEEEYNGISDEEFSLKGGVVHKRNVKVRRKATEGTGDYDDDQEWGRRRSKTGAGGKARRTTKTSNQRKAQSTESSGRVVSRRKSIRQQQQNPMRTRYSGMQDDDME